MGRLDLERFLRCRILTDDDGYFDMRFAPADGPPYHLWGITIYRTAYGTTPATPDSDRHWQMLLESVQAHVREEILNQVDPDNEKTADAARKLLALFRLDARSNAETLAGASLDQLRAVWNAGGAGGEPVVSSHRLRQARVFLVADEEVLARVARQAQREAGDEEEQEEGEPFVKCVEVDYRAGDHIPRPGNRVQRSQIYFGWAKLATSSLLRFWAVLENGGHLQDFVPTGPWLKPKEKIWTGDDEGW